MQSRSLPRARGRPAVLFVSHLQLGVHTDTTKYCEHLRDRYELTYLSIDQGLPRRELDGVAALYCSRHPLGKVELGLFMETLRLLRSHHFDLVYLRRNKYCFLLRLLRPRVPMIFDVRSGSIEDGALRRGIEDALTWFNARFFRHISVISEGLARRLHLPRRAHVVPLGADPVAVRTTRKPGVLRLVYIGTFKNRALERTIEGLRLFLDDGRRLQCRYSMVGFGSEQEVEQLQQAIARLRVSDLVRLEQRIDHDDVPRMLAEHDVGVAFTPRTPWYECQPSTKIYEYLSVGLLCLATDSAANRDVISIENGVLVEDSAEGVRQGLHRVADLLPATDPDQVARSVKDDSWARIVDDYLVPLMERSLR